MESVWSLGFDVQSENCAGPARHASGELLLGTLQHCVCERL